MHTPQCHLVSSISHGMLSHMVWDDGKQFIMQKGIGPSTGVCLLSVSRLLSCKTESMYIAVILLCVLIVMHYTPSSGPNGPCKLERQWTMAVMVV